MEESPAIQVFIRNVAGEYLSRKEDDWEFTKDPAAAYIFDYHADEVAAQIKQAYTEHCVVWIAYPVDPKLVLTCIVT